MHPCEVESLDWLFFFLLLFFLESYRQSGTSVFTFLWPGWFELFRLVSGQDSWLTICVANFVVGNDPHIWTAEYIERSLRNDIKTTNCTNKRVQPRLTREASLPSHYLFSIQMITCCCCHHFMFMPSLSYVISLAALCVCSHLSKESSSLFVYSQSAFSFSSVISLLSIPLWFFFNPL